MTVTEGWAVAIATLNDVETQLLAELEDRTRSFAGSIRDAGGTEKCVDEIQEAAQLLREARNKVTASIHKLQSIRQRP